MFRIVLVAGVAALVLAPVGSGVTKLRACTAKDLRAHGQLQGATGSMIGPIVFRNVSSSACRVGGRPRVTIRDRAGRLLRTKEAPVQAKSIGYRPVTKLRAGQRASLYLWWSQWCGSWPQGVYNQKLILHVSLTTGRNVKAGFQSGRPRCDVRTGSKLGVSPFGVPR